MAGRRCGGAVRSLRLAEKFLCRLLEPLSVVENARVSGRDRAIIFRIVDAAVGDSPEHELSIHANVGGASGIAVASAASLVLRDQKFGFAESIVLNLNFDVAKGTAASVCDAVGDAVTCEEDGGSIGEMACVREDLRGTVSGRKASGEFHHRDVAGVQGLILAEGPEGRNLVGIGLSHDACFFVFDVGAEDDAKAARGTIHAVCGRYEERVRNDRGRAEAARFNVVDADDCRGEFLAAVGVCAANNTGVALARGHRAGSGLGACSQGDRAQSREENEALTQTKSHIICIHEFYPPVDGATSPSMGG